MKKNCFNCKHLDFYEKEEPESYLDEGYTCKKRDLDASHNKNLIEKMEDRKYLEKPKKCCSL